MPLDSLNVLLVEDNPGDVGLFKQALREAYGSRFNLAHYASLGAALESLSRTHPDVIVVDLGLPDVCGIEVVKRCRAMAPAIAVVVSTARDDEALGVQALHEGAQDYLTKGELDARLLARALRYAIERQRMQVALQSESVIDELTRLYNRKGFVALADNHIKAVARTGQPFCLAFIDLDGMKQINDTLGHVAGDRALIEAADLLSRCVRQSDVLARFGGDEFVILLTSAREDTENLIQSRVRQAVETCNSRPGRQYRLSLSLGVVTVTGRQGLTLETVLMRADERMYQQKHLNRTTHQPPRLIAALE